VRPVGLRLLTRPALDKQVDANPKPNPLNKQVDTARRLASLSQTNRSL